MLRDIVAAKPSAFWLEELEANNVSCGPINRLDQVFSDPQVLARGMLLEMPHPALGTAPVKMAASPIKMSKTQVSYDRPPPMVGQHTDEILREMIGASDDDLATLRDDGVI